MTSKPPTHEKTIAAARQAIEEGHTDEARQLLEAAIHSDAQDPRPWLLLAGIAATPRERRVMLAQAKRLDASQPATTPAVPGQTTARRRRRSSSRAGLGLILLLMLVGLVALVGFHPNGRALVANMAGNSSNAAEEIPAPSEAAGQVPTQIAGVALPASPVPSVESSPVFPTKAIAIGGAPLPTWTPTPLPTPTLAPTLTPSPTPEPSATPEPIPLSLGQASPRPPGVGEGERWIDVNLATQTLVAYEGDVPVFETLVSSGTWEFPTVTGQFRTYMKYESQTMNGYLLGYDYYLPDVPYVMYFYKDYAIHGTYWHSNFGTPMSHGCVNVSTPDAGWLFSWAPIGTLVNVRS